ncbi:PPOX class probable F420-dependent enzyme [Saccharopolyspora lacisalsi]|uniref:PPOX class probable F420-dependent enzyme n=1 Tax=Halosaccharopolyspora lacisalsi TaxID=1000566 RepID=A0A839E1M4_9PSEU|nr:PPOX class F420-dependent oxidoreductase [Halosaccharopolyspora lacisalsi]MBA8825615.1 PPOX class probable F420-dependent enzyme [Halosaccharopolyspora lacisalsi]
MASITDEKVRGFLEHGTRTGKIGYSATDGRPLTVPVWFVLEADEIVFTTGGDTAKGVSIGRGPRLAMCVDLEEQPYAFVQVQGEAMVSENPDELLRMATVIAARYVGTERAEEFGRRNGVPGELLVRLRPTRVVAEFDITA